jgi:hypothetical protein
MGTKTHKDLQKQQAGCHHTVESDRKRNQKKRNKTNRMSNKIKRSAFGEIIKRNNTQFSF